MDNKNRSLRDIAELASQRLGGVRGRALDREAKRRGFTLSYTTVDKILSGKYTSRPTKATLEALSDISGVPLDEVYAAANVGLPMESLAAQLPPEVDTLSADQRRIVIDLARQFVKQNKREHELHMQLEGTATNDNQNRDDTGPTDDNSRALAPSGDARSRQKIDALTPEEIKIVTMRENRRRQREHGDFMHGISEHPEMSTSMLKQGKSQKEVRDALIEAGKSSREEIRALRIAGESVLKEHVASATPGSNPKKGARYEVVNPTGSVSGYSSSGSITELHGAEAAKYPVPSREKLAAHPKVKTRREQLDEQTGERDGEGREGQ